MTSPPEGITTETGNYPFGYYLTKFAQLPVWKLPAGDAFNALTATLTGFRFGGNPLTIAFSTMAENVMSVGFLDRCLPLAQFLRRELSRNL